MTRLVIDADLCQGTGECVALGGDRIELDDLGIALVREPFAAIDPDLAARIVATCPSGAVSAAED